MCLARYIQRHMRLGIFSSFDFVGEGGWGDVRFFRRVLADGFIYTYGSGIQLGHTVRRDAKSFPESSQGEASKRVISWGVHFQFLPFFCSKDARLYTGERIAYLSVHRVFLCQGV